MKHLTGIAILAGVGLAGWRIGGTLSEESLGMALGLLFGVMAGIPAILIGLSALNRPETPQTPHVKEIEVKPVQTPVQQITNVYHQHLHIHPAPGQQMQLPKRHEIEVQR